MKLACDFTFDAAHRILGHSGKCAYLHGHTYRLEVTVSAAELDALGMVMDFDDLRALVKKAVLDRWDHATLLWKEDPLGPAVTSAQTDAPEKVVALDGQPTAEVLTRLAFAEKCGCLGARGLTSLDPDPSEARRSERIAGRTSDAPIRERRLWRRVHPQFECSAIGAPQST